MGELAQHSHANSLTDNNHTHLQNTDGTAVAVSPGSGRNVLASGVTGTTGVPNTAPMSITNANSGSSAAMAWLQPTIMLNCILRVI
jgi:hypothetical protein